MTDLKDKSESDSEQVFEIKKDEIEQLENLAKSECEFLEDIEAIAEKEKEGFEKISSVKNGSADEKGGNVSS